MSRQSRTRPVGGCPAPVVLVLFAAACAAPAEEPAEPEIGAVVVTQWNDSTELFLEYPHLVAGQPTGNWAIHLTDRKDSGPVRSGTLTIDFASQGASQSFTVDAPARDGIFLLDPRIDEPGTYSVRLSLESPQVTSRHQLPGVRVYATLEETPVQEEEAGGGIAFLKEQQWVIPFDVQAAAERPVQRTVSAPAEIVPPDGALVHVTAPVDGIAATDENRGAPSVGQPVRRGEVLAILAPANQEGGFARARGQVERLEREVERASRLVAAGAIPRLRLDEARHALGIARAEFEAMAGNAGEVAEGADDYRLRLTAPIGGVIAERTLVPGDRVEAGEMLFTVVDPSLAWLRTRVPAALASSLAREEPASFVVEGSDEVFRASPLRSAGTVIDPGTRTVPAVFEVANDVLGLVFGQLATVAVPVGQAASGVAIPASAIVDDSGTPVAYVQTGGESFERRPLTLGASDGFATLVVSGISAGEMVVTRGAYQVRLASLSGNEFAGSHAH